MMKLFCLVSAILLLTVNGKRLSKRQVIFFDDESSKNCKTPDNMDGSCVRLFDCQPINSRLRSGSPTKEFFDFVRKSTCRYDGNVPVVCCPDVVEHTPIIVQPRPPPDQPRPPAQPRPHVQPRPPAQPRPHVQPRPPAQPRPTVHFIPPAQPRPTVQPRPPVQPRPSVQPRPPVQSSRLVASPIPSQQTCGDISRFVLKVVGGEETRKGSWPWIVALGYNNRQGNHDFNCGGALITNRHILTAAHCVFNRNDLTMIRLGEHDLNDDGDSAHEDFRITKRIIHEDYNNSNSENDIAILVVDRPIRFTDNISPICLPKGAFFAGNDFAGETAYIAGWGSTKFKGARSNVLMQADVPVRKLDDCKRTFASFNDRVIDGRNICAGIGDKDACNGDSGGPLVVINTIEKTFAIIGIVSFGYECAVPNFPTVYTGVMAFMDWIERNII